jgi:hypothetical protein
MNKRHHSNNILLNLGIENLNEMQEAAQETILNDNNVLLLSDRFRSFFITNIRNVTA